MSELTHFGQTIVQTGTQRLHIATHQARPTKDPSWLHHIGKAEEERCPFGHDSQDGHHIALCPIHEEVGKRLIGAREDNQWNLEGTGPAPPRQGLGRRKGTLLGWNGVLFHPTHLGSGYLHVHSGAGPGRLTDPSPLSPPGIPGGMPCSTRDRVHVISF